ncbi:hypothetical protein [Streptomyces sp. TRM68367]|uniref:hypothetical protein n=1 Tax=Streptomyces sp. TRM68367 TaxID=2758415 RepID=UPI00165BF8C4|nr:hypothetical protein [Streptomyces sp. TRM68367]MBC9726712.1 hypothetical protein [Streptomyces sp. TRM68367]
MPRGRHRHSPPLHRLLPPSAIAGVSTVCALGPWAFSEQSVLRGLAAAAAVTAVVGAVVMRRWDIQAGKQVADLTRARVSDEWRYEERVAELETDLEESRELRVKLEHRLRAKRAELTALRNEHAALLRRYATAETQRASALEGRRLLETEAAAPASSGRELTAGPSAETPAREAAAEERPAIPAVFSPEGSQLFLRARAALARFDGGPADGKGTGGDGDGPGKGTGEPAAKDDDKAAQVAPVRTGALASADAGDTAAAPAQEDEAQGQPGAADGHEHAAAAPTPGASAQTAQPDPSAQSAQASGHFTVPRAVAVVPPTMPVRRPAAEGGFDFFGTHKGASQAALESVQNEDLADVVGQEALALHKAETESQFKPADEESRSVGQVIDLTAHDETEQIDVQGLRSAVS